MSEWQSMKTAPRDGSKVLLFILDGPGVFAGVVAIGYYRNHLWHCEGWGEVHPSEVSGWMPLPDQPTR